MITVVQDQAAAGAAPVLIAGVLFAALAAALLITASRGVFVGLTPSMSCRASAT